MTTPIAQVRDMIYGLDQEVPLLDGRTRPYVNFDNAATTPAFRAVVDCVNESLVWYSSVHRGTGYKSLMSSHLYERCRDEVLGFAGADLSYHTAVFCSNTTDAINRLCHCMPHDADDVVITTVMEHHSNMLPWRFHAKVEYAQIDPSNGTLDISDLEAKLRQHAGKVRLVAVTGASNVTGVIPPLREIAVLAHQYGARLLVDGAQLAAHRPIRMGQANDPERIDFLAFSGHKMYAPFGSGVLIGPRECFEAAVPYPMGGGTVELVTLNEVEWADAPEKLEAGTPNLIGALALSKAMGVLRDIGMEAIADHERELTALALDLLSGIAGITVYGSAKSSGLSQTIPLCSSAPSSSPDLACPEPACPEPAEGVEGSGKTSHSPSPSLPPDRVGVIPLLSEKMNHALLAAILGYEYGIGVRHGCFCAHPYAGQLLGLQDAELKDYIAQIRAGDRSNLPGFVRVSIGIYNTAEEVQYLADSLREIMANGPCCEYQLDRRTGQYTPIGFSYNYDSLAKTT